MTIPRGTLAIIIDDKGHVIASAADFDQSKQGFGTVFDAQERRASARAWNAAIQEGCWRFADAITSSYLTRSSIEGYMHSHKGWETVIRRIEPDGNCTKPDY